MSIKENAMLVSLTVSKPQMTAKDDKATADAEQANNAHGAGQYRKDLYPKALVAPITAVEAAARAYIDSTTYMWNRGQYLLPTARFMEFADRMGRFELEFSQCVTAFLNNWAQVMQEAKRRQGALFDAGAYPDLDDLRRDFRFRIQYAPVTDAGDFRVALQESELDSLRAEVERNVKESMDAVLRQPLQRLRETVARLHEVAGKPVRHTTNKAGKIEEKPPIFRDSVCENIAHEITLLHDFAGVLPDSIMAVAKDVADNLPHPQLLRDSPDKRAETRDRTAALLASIDSMLEG
jgi:hypothetical protein